MALAIQPDFLAQLRQNRGLSEDAFARACGVSRSRLEELSNGATPTMLEFSNIQLGFNCGDKGIPMIASESSDGVKDKQGLVA